MTINSAQLKEAARLINQMLSDVRDSWAQQHLLVWRVSK